jgi:RecJ-like exonuclease
MKKSLKLLLLLALFGILLVLLVSLSLVPKQLTLVSNITEKSLGQEVKVQGHILSLKQYSNDTFQVLSFQDSTGIIEATANSKTGLKGLINYSLNYSITGKVTEYNKTLQLTIDQLAVSS